MGWVGGCCLCWTAVDPGTIPYFLFSLFEVIGCGMVLVGIVR